MIAEKKSSERAKKFDKRICHDFEAFAREEFYAEKCVRITSFF
jgi:hypothetical protein